MSPDQKQQSQVGQSSSLRALLGEFERIERLSLSEIQHTQHLKLVQLSQHFDNGSVLFRERLRSAGLATLTADNFCQLPVLTRQQLQRAGEDIFVAPPPMHLPVSETRTSGSSGEPVAVHRTALTQLFWLGYSMREHLWWQRDFTGTLAVVRANLGVESIALDSWGPPASLLTTTGPGYAMSLTLDVASQAANLVAINPHYLMTYPNNLNALLSHIECHRLSLPRLRQIRSMGETLGPDLRERCRHVLNVSIADTYSSQEVGVIAIECPHSGLYHVMAENLVVEVVADDGRPCRDGEIGQVVVTDLHNFATPLIRYAIGDLAEVGPPCRCGRSLPTLRRILGRTRNMVSYPDGTKRYPLVGFSRFRDVAPIAQYQAVQLDIDTLEMHLVVERCLSAVEEAALAAIVCDAIGHPFSIRFRYCESEIPRGPGGKFEEFISLVSG